MIIVEAEPERKLLTVTYCGRVVRLREGYDVTLNMGDENGCRVPL